MRVIKRGSGDDHTFDCRSGRFPNATWVCAENETNRYVQFFLSDGITEQYIDHEYFCADPASSARRKMFDVDDIKFAASAERNL